MLLCVKMSAKKHLWIQRCRIIQLWYKNINQPDSEYIGQYYDQIKFPRTIQPLLFSIVIPDKIFLCIIIVLLPFIEIALIVFSFSNCFFSILTDTVFVNFFYSTSLLTSCTELYPLISYIPIIRRIIHPIIKLLTREESRRHLSYFFIRLFIIHSKLDHTFYTTLFYTIIVLKKNTFS